MGDGSEEEFVPVDVGYVPPAHNSWVVGNEPRGSFLKCRFDIISLPLFFSFSSCCYKSKLAELFHITILITFRMAERHSDIFSGISVTAYRLLLITYVQKDHIR